MIIITETKECHYGTKLNLCSILAYFIGIVKHFGLSGRDIIMIDMGGKSSSMKAKGLVSGEKYHFNLFSLTWIFVLFSVLGFLFEGFWSVISFGHWDNHYALVWGHFTIIYGFAVVGLMLLYPILGKRRMITQFLVCFVLGSFFEFGVSWLQEFVFGTRSWNYYHLPYNLDGRICLRMSLVWGFVGMVFLRLGANRIIKFARFFENRMMQKLGLVLFIFMVCNFAVSIMATARYSERHYGIRARDNLDLILDQRFPDERMRRIYYNMEFTK